MFWRGGGIRFIQEILEKHRIAKSLVKLFTRLLFCLFVDAEDRYASLIIDYQVITSFVSILGTNNVCINANRELIDENAS